MCVMLNVYYVQWLNILYVLTFQNASSRALAPAPRFRCSAAHFASNLNDDKHNSIRRRGFYFFSMPRRGKAESFASSKSALLLSLSLSFSPSLSLLVLHRFLCLWESESVCHLEMYNENAHNSNIIISDMIFTPWQFVCQQHIFDWIGGNAGWQTHIHTLFIHLFIIHRCHLCWSLYIAATAAAPIWTHPIFCSHFLLSIFNCRFAETQNGIVFVPDNIRSHRIDKYGKQTPKKKKSLSV